MNCPSCKTELVEDNKGDERYRYARCPTCRFEAQVQALEVTQPQTLELLGKRHLRKLLGEIIAGRKAFDALAGVFRVLCPEELADAPGHQAVMDQIRETATTTLPSPFAHSARAEIKPIDPSDIELLKGVLTGAYFETARKPAPFNS